MDRPTLNIARILLYLRYKYTIMRNILFILAALSIFTACEEPEKIIEQLPPPTPYNVRFEVECDTCTVFYAVNGFGNLDADSCFGFYSHDTVIFIGDGVNITAMDQDYICDSIDVRIFINDSLVAKDWEYGTPGIDFLFASSTYILE